MLRTGLFKTRLGVRARLVLLVLAAIVPFAAFIAYQISELHQRRTNEALHRVLEYAQLGADAYQQTIAEAKSLLELIASVDEVTGGSPEACQHFLASVSRSRRWANGLWVVGEDGRVRCSTVSNGIGLDVSSRKEYRDAVSARAFSVSDFFVGKLRAIPLAMAFLPAHSKTGEHILVGVSLDLSWFDRLSAIVGERSGATIMFLDSNGTVVSRFPHDPALVGRNLGNVPAVATLLQASSGRFEAIRLDGKQAFWGYVKLADTNMRLAVNFDRSAVLAPLHRGIVQAIVIFGLVASGIAVLIWLGGNTLFASPMRELDELLQATLDNMDQGLIVVDKHGRLPICNTRAMQLLDLPPHLMSRRPTSEAVIAYQQERGEFANCSDEVRSRVFPRTFGEGRSIYERERPNGIVLEVRTVPFAGGGVVRTYTDVTARRNAERILEGLVNKDGLTGLGNRRFLDATLQKELARAKRSGSELALIMVDVDFFKAFNDRYGHLAGDACLQHVAAGIEAHIQRPGDSAARYGGEEFAVVLPDTDLAGALKVAEQIRQAVADVKREHLGSQFGFLTISAGVAAVAHNQHSSVDAIIEAAEKALYNAKSCGRDRVEVAQMMDICERSAAA